MTIHTRIVTVIIAVATVIIVCGLAVGTYFLTRHMSAAIENDMMIVVDIADKYVANEVTLLKIQAAEAADRINAAGLGGSVLERVGAEYPAFMGLAVFSGTTLLDFWGNSPLPPDLAGKPFMDFARSGGQAVSTTMHSPDGDLIMCVSAPMDNGLVLAAVLPGQYFSDLLSRFTIYQTGHLFIDDADGHVIVNIRPEWVQDRINFMEMARENSLYQDLGTMVERGIAGEQGTARFTVDGVPRICAFRPVSSPNEGWFVGIIAPLTESPLKEIPFGIFMIGLITFVLSVAAAFLAADLIRRPYLEMERLREAAEAASKAKSVFLATMSHEIRTPLNAVIGLGELTLGEKNLGPEARTNLEKICGAGSTILGIVNDILDISKIESGKFELYPVKYDTPSLINDVVTLNLIRIGEKDITFKLTVDENLPGALYGDDLRVRQIFGNLLSNAFKFTSAGTVEWQLSFELDGEDVWLVSSVKDTGIGIRPEHLRTLFSDYTQLDMTINRKMEGTGLGLAIVKRLAEMMDGGITVASEYGLGTTFTVRLRQTLVSATPLGREVADSLMGLRYSLSRRANGTELGRVDLSYAHVLVVDDIETNIDVTRGMLKPSRLKVDSAASGREAIELIKAENPRYSAIFMDHMMPEMDGVEATRIIREELGTDYARKIPIIALTANAIHGNEEIFLSRGFQDFISKPIDVKKLDSVLRRWVRDKNLEKDPAGELALDQEEPTSTGFGFLLEDGAIGGLDWRRALNRFGGDASVLLDVLRSYAANTPGLLSRLRDGLAAGNLADYAIVVHGIKGSSYGIYAQAVGKAAEDLEIAAQAGDQAAVESGQPAFLKIAEALLADLDRALGKLDLGADRPLAAAPDPALLEQLRAACADFDMDRVDALMEQLEAFRYEHGGKLVLWLREQVGNMTFEEIFSGEWPTE